MIWLQAYFLVGLATMLTVWRRGLHPRFRQVPLFLIRGDIGPWVQFRHKILVPFLMGVFLCVAWPVCWAWVVHDRWHVKREAKRREDTVFKILPIHRSVGTTVERVEARAKVEDPLGAVPDLPFGHLNGAWNNFIAKRPEGASLYPFECVWVTFHREKFHRKGFVWFTDGVCGPFWLTRDLKVDD